MDILVRLYWSFVKIGFSSFGGMSMIPQISAEMLSNGWMNAAQVNDIVAIAEMTPGPLGFNCATFAGIQAAGIPGALAANCQSNISSCHCEESRDSSHPEKSRDFSQSQLFAL